MIRRARLERDEELDAIVRAIVDDVRPARVILFGSRARGEARPDSDYDLVVELEFDRAEYYAVRGRVFSAARSGAGASSVDILLRTPGELEQRRDDPGYLDWEIARDGTIVYPRESDDQTLRPRPRSAVAEDEPLSSIADWLARAEEDAIAIEALLDRTGRISWTAVAFHAQQLAEKHLKVLFIVQRMRPPRTHALSALVTELAADEYDLLEIWYDAKLLESFAVDPRYPGDVAIPTEDKGRAAVAAARRIVDAVKPLLGG